MAVSCDGPGAESKFAIIRARALTRSEMRRPWRTFLQAPIAQLESRNNLARDVDTRHPRTVRPF
jgi:hypothetical protein